MRLFSVKRKLGWLAVEVSSEKVTVAHVRPNPSGRPEVLLCDSYRKEGSDADMLGRLRKELKLDRYRCTTALSFGEYQILQIEPPAVAADELKSAVRWRVKSMLDYPVDEATIDVLDVPMDKNVQARSRSMFAVCAPNLVVEKYVKLYQSAGIALEVIDVPEVAQRNIAALFEPVGRGVAMLGFSDEGGLLTFTFGGELYMSRRIDITLRQLVDAGDEARHPLFERIVLELQRSLDNFEHQFHFINLAKLIITPLPQDIGLSTHLAANLYLAVENIDLGSVMDFAAAPELKQKQRQAQCLGLLGIALRNEGGRA